jgi:D-proline reductase (dithiol) PrdB
MFGPGLTATYASILIVVQHCFMARLEDIPEAERDAITGLRCPTFEATPCVEGPPLSQRRVAIVSTAGLHRRGDRPFGLTSGDYRVIPGGTVSADIVMSHISPNFDRTGFQADVNVAFPLERLRDMAASGEIGSVADFHYSFMGATDPQAMEPKARELASLLHADAVDAVLLVPI